MYQELGNQPVQKQPAHLDTAQQIANELLERFQPKELAEILAIIEQRIKQEWKMRIEKAYAGAKMTEESAQPLFAPPAGLVAKADYTGTR